MSCPLIPNVPCIQAKEDRLDNKYRLPLQFDHCSFFLLLDDDITFEARALKCLHSALHEPNIYAAAPRQNMRGVALSHNFHAAIPQFLLVRRHALELYSKHQYDQPLMVCDDFDFANALFDANKTIRAVTAPFELFVHKIYPDALHQRKGHYEERSKCKTHHPKTSARHSPVFSC